MPIEQLFTADIELSMILHNLQDMEQVRSDLTYAIYANDMKALEREMSEICEVIKYFNEQEEN
ncbi:MAG: hypothetical protein OXU23_18965 [Candidatus Poribacteria bacterium]|nr:hypothetical protein [Candidatus Poribacteria bacterium]